MITAGRLAAPPVVSRPHLSAEQQVEKFPPRHSTAHWSAAEKDREEVLRMWIEATPRQEDPRNHDFRGRGLMLMLDWLAEQPGDTWHQRWHASGADAAGEQWADGSARWLEQHGKLSRTRLETMTSSLVVMIGADVVRPSLAWLLTGGKKRKLARNMIRARDADGFARLDDFCRADDGISDMARRAALFRTAVIIAAKGGTVADIVVGDLLEVLEVEAELRGQRRSGSATFRALRETGVFGTGVPTLREIRSIGQRPVEDLVDSYPIACRPIRDLLVEYLKERQPTLDYGTLRGQTYQLVKCFWQDLELHHPGIDSLRLPADVAAAWKQRLRTRLTTTTTNSERVESVVERLGYQDILAGVRAFYLDLAQWALEEPGRWGSWVAPCPVSQQDLSRRKTTRRRKARMDARTRERLSVLPILVRSADQHRRDSEALLAAGRQAESGQQFTAVGQSLTRIRRPHAKPANIWAEDPATGQRRLLNREEDNAFWAWAIIEVLRLTGVRAEEMLELSHHSLVQYRLPTTGEVVPLLQIAPSKTDTERLLVVSPELADVLSAIICRIRNSDGAVPLVRARDYHELLWMPPAPLLFQRSVDIEPQRIARERVSSLLDEALACTGLIDQADGTPLHYTPHDFRRIFITDAILNGLPPHIAQVIAGHQDIAVTIGYKAVYPEETIKSHLAFLARRRSLRPSEEYRTPTDAEWQEFLGHFERRKVATGLCGRAFSTPCIHEHACLRCSMHWPDSDQRHRIEEIRDNLIARIAEAEREGWLGEVEGLQTSLAGANDKLAQIDRRSGAGSVDLPASVLRSAGSTYTDTGRSELASRFHEVGCPRLDQISGECS